MAPKSKGRSAKLSAAGLIKKIRGSLGVTQQGMADLLCVSRKAVQSYEQGWRIVPNRVVREALTLMAFKGGKGMSAKPCWQVTKCDAKRRELCPSKTLSNGRFCWFVAARTCLKMDGKKPKDPLPCLTCPVTEKLLG